MNNLQRMRQLAGINESGSLVPSVGDINEAYDDIGFIKQSIANIHPEYMSYDDLKAMVGKETGYNHNPSFDDLFKQAYDSFYGMDPDVSDEEDYTDYTMNQGEMGDPDRMRESAPPGMEDTVLDLKKEYPGEPEKAFASAWAIYNKKHGATDESLGDYSGPSSDGDFNEPDDYNFIDETGNGYTDVNYANPDDFFPNGADGPVTTHVGPTGGRQGDNPEQKRLAVKETHRELVYNYRNFLRESSGK